MTDSSEPSESSDSPNPQAKLTQAERNRLADKIVRALGALEETWQERIFNTHTGAVFSHNSPDGRIMPDGTAVLGLHLSARFINKLSAHQKIEVSNFRKRMNEDFQALAAPLARLLPGQALRWTLEIETKPRHALGAGHTPQSSEFINTPKNRLKAPLIRLSKFFEKTNDNTDPKPGQWLFTRPKTPFLTTLTEGRLTLTRIDARSLGDAVRLAGFYKFKGNAIIEPKPLESMMVLEAGNPIDIPTPDAPTSEEIDSIHGQFTAALGDETILDRLVKTLQTLRADRNFKMKLDLMTGEVSTQCVDHPLANPQDLASTRKIRAQARSDLDRIKEPLIDTIRNIHPGLQYGAMKFHLENAIAGEDTPINIIMNIDNIITRMVISDDRNRIHDCVRQIFINATALAPHIVAGPDHIYAFEKDYSDKDTHQVNTTRTITIIHATNPTHAWLIYAMSQNQAQSGMANIRCLRELHPVPQDIVIALSEDTAQRIAKIWPT